MARRERTRLAWVPCWDGNVKSWTKWFINENKWRMDNIHSFDDLMQDCWMVFFKIDQRYPRVVEEANFMGLYKRAVMNQFNDRSLYMKRKRLVHQDTSCDVSELYTGRIGEQSNAGYVMALLAEQPEELKLALKIIADNPAALRETPRDVRRRGRENLSKRLQRVMGVDLMDFDFVSTMKSLFG